MLFLVISVTKTRRSRLVGVGQSEESEKCIAKLRELRASDEQCNVRVIKKQTHWYFLKFANTWFMFFGMCINLVMAKQLTENGVCRTSSCSIIFQFER